MFFCQGLLFVRDGFCQGLFLLFVRDYILLFPGTTEYSVTSKTRDPKTNTNSTVSLCLCFSVFLFSSLLSLFSPLFPSSLLPFFPSSLLPFFPSSLLLCSLGGLQTLARANDDDDDEEAHPEQGEEQDDAMELEEEGAFVHCRSRHV